jgi:hypothetical protein
VRQHSVSNQTYMDLSSPQETLRPRYNAVAWSVLLVRRPRTLLATAGQAALRPAPMVRGFNVRVGIVLHQLPDAPIRARNYLYCLSEKQPDSKKPTDRGRRDASQPVPRDQSVEQRLAREATQHGHGSEEEAPVFDETAARAAEILELLEGLRAFRQRIIDDAQAMAKQIRTPKEQVDASLAKHPDIAKIDASIRRLEAELKAISDNV